MYHFNAYTWKTDAGYEGFAVEQHSGVIIHKADTEQGVIDNMKQEFADEIAKLLCVKSTFDFDNPSHQDKINQRLHGKTDVSEFRKHTFTITEEEIIASKREDNGWLAKTYDTEILQEHADNCNVCQPSVSTTLIELASRA